jgi:hypothetical protein
MSTDKSKVQPSVTPVATAVMTLVQALGVGLLGMGAAGHMTVAQAQPAVSTPGEAPASALLESSSGKTVKPSTMIAAGPRVAYRSIEGIALSSATSNLPVSADEGLWRESLGLPVDAKLLMSASAAQVPADGRSAITLKIELFDSKGAPITAPTKLFVQTSHGTLQAPDGKLVQADTAPGLQKGGYKSFEVAVSGGVIELVLLAPIEPGDAMVKVSGGAVTVQGELSFVPDLRDMLVVGIVEGAINLSRVKGAGAGSIRELEFSESLRNWEKTRTKDIEGGIQYNTLAGRVALFAKGTIKGEYLLTLAADTDKITSQKLFRDIDPNAYYPIYGDSSVKKFDAQSASKLYVRVDKNKSYLLYGDLTTASTDQANKLANYSRSMTGFKGNYEDESMKLTAFAARTANKQYVDEQPGRGISGPYALGKPNAIVNTEIVEILVRDRDQPAVVLSRKTLTRYVDYDFEPFSGRILFREPVPSVDERGNPVTLRIAYEVEEEFADKHWVAGVNAKVNLSRNIAVGASYVKDFDKAAPFEVAGVNAEIKLGEKTYFVAELAKSKGNSQINQSLSTAEGGEALKPNSGTAVRAELRHEDDKLKARVALVKTDEGFQNASSGITGGRTEISALASYAVTPDVEVKATYVKNEDTSSTETKGAKRDALGVSVGVNLTDKINGSAGTLSGINVTSTDNNSVPGWGFNGSGLLESPDAALTGLSKDAPEEADNNYTSARVKVTAKVTPEASVYGEYEQALGDGEKRRITVGGEYRLSEKTRLYAMHELKNTLTGFYGLGSDNKSRANTVVGLASAIDVPYLPDGQIYGEYRAAGGFDNRDIAAAAGIRNRWKLATNLALDTAFERQKVIAADGQEKDATAFAISGEYVYNEVNRFAGRLEYRTSDTQDQWLSTAAYTRILSENWSALVKNAYTRFEGQGLDIEKGTQLQNQLQVGLAYRDVEKGRWNGLFKLENRIDRSISMTTPKDEHAWIASAHGVYHPVQSLTFGAQVAGKKTLIVNFPDRSENTYNAWMAGGRIIWDFADRFDASLYGSVGRDNRNKIYGIGLEVGARLVDDLWFSVGYTKGRYADIDAFSANTSWTGWHVRLRYKFDETNLGLDRDKAREAEPVKAVPPVAVTTPVQ